MKIEKWICLEKEKTKIEKQHYLDEILCLPVQFFRELGALGAPNFRERKKLIFLIKNCLFLSNSIYIVGALYK